MTVNLEQEHGPFDIIGDVHGCFAELHELLTKLGYVIDEEDATVNSVSGSINLIAQFPEIEEQYLLY